MRNILLAGIAAIALAAGQALAQSKGEGKGGGKGHEAHAAQPKGGGQGRDQDARQDRGRGQEQRGANNARRAVPPDRGPERRAETRAPDNRGRDAADRGQRVQSDRGRGDSDRVRTANADRGPASDDRVVVDRVVDRRGDNRVVRIDNEFRKHDVFAARSRGLIDGCPPGLARKNNGCRPPGLARQQDSAWRRALYQPAWWGLSGLAAGSYFYDDGYLYRVNDGVVAGYVPLLGGALGIGNPWPAYYDPVPLPVYYQDYYGLGPPDAYRYADNVIYGVDPGSSAINSILALMTGDTFAIGQAMPIGYDVYNVPYPYRDRYYDSDDAYYRYSDGYIYQVDPETQLIAAIIELLA